jgi:hypothetical protein
MHLDRQTERDQPVVNGEQEGFFPGTSRHPLDHLEPGEQFGWRRRQPGGAARAEVFVLMVTRRRLVISFQQFDSINRNGPRQWSSRPESRPYRAHRASEY